MVMITNRGVNSVNWSRLNDKPILRARSICLEDFHRILTVIVDLSTEESSYVTKKELLSPVDSPTKNSDF